MFRGSFVPFKRWLPGALVALGFWHPSSAADWPVGTMTRLEAGAFGGGVAGISADGRVLVGAILVPVGDEGFFDSHAAYWSNGSTAPNDSDGRRQKAFLPFPPQPAWLQRRRL